MACNYQRLVQLHEGRSLIEARDDLREAFRSKALRPQDIDLGRLFEQCFGMSAFRDCRAGHRLASEVMKQALTEAEGAVSTSSFLNISGQFVYQTVLDGYENEEFVFKDLIPEAQASTLDGEKIPGITEIGDEIAVRNEADPYALAGVGEDWIFTPSIPDRGMIVPITWEAIFNDKTGQLSERCGKVGYWAGVRREKAAIDCVIDENVTSHRYNWRGTVIATYNDNTGTHTWDNLVASNALVDWTDLDNVEQAFNAMTDPYTGEPVMIAAKHLVVTKQLEQTAYHILNSTMIRRATPGYATSANPNLNELANPYQKKYELKTSRLLAARLATDTSWFLGDYGKFAKCMMAEKLNVVQAPPNSDDEFKRRIVTQHRVNERFAYVTVQPRASVKSTA